MEKIVRFGIDNSVQPVALIVELDHGLVERDVIRLGTVCRLSVGLLDPIVNSRTPSSTPNHSQIETVSESDNPHNWSWILSFMSSRGVCSRSTKI